MLFLYIFSDWDAPDDFHPEETDSAADFSKNQFLDLSKPLFRQVWEGNFSKSYYLQQIHQPRHLNESARFFGPDVLEMLTRTVWWVVPLFWGPIFSYLFARSVVQFALPRGAALRPFTVDPAQPLLLFGAALTAGNVGKVRSSSF
jgi:4-hydroxysphinganine ceramide fatty acyl 2-hydroxylase